jgi:hypothetical protein
MDAPGEAEVGVKDGQQVRCQTAHRGDFYRQRDDYLKNLRTFCRVKDSMAGSFLHGAPLALRLRGRSPAECAMFAIERQAMRGGPRWPLRANIPEPGGAGESPKAAARWRHEARRS